MGIDYQITDAAHLYGLDNMGATATLAASNASIIGSALTTVDSWGSGGLPAGQTGVETITMSGGFTEKVGLSNIDGTNFVLDAVQLFRTATNELLLTSSPPSAFGCRASTGRVGIPDLRRPAAYPLREMFPASTREVC
ncbi:hypothetical protein [Ferrovum myxofaciens]|uniref:hypothetical protein n=1 Tax=Ferrovum myxofaciens TaxID=416213 RepID=UPI002353D4CE|nr:hypothetical protein [Ferrovum myxofaciens]MBU6994283.1 hypothetical protein [Ferrovum myxofaciens]